MQEWPPSQLRLRHPAYSSLPLHPAVGWGNFSPAWREAGWLPSQRHGEPHRQDQHGRDSSAGQHTVTHWQRFRATQITCACDLLLVAHSSRSCYHHNPLDTCWRCDELTHFFGFEIFILKRKKMKIILLPLASSGKKTSKCPFSFR